MSDVYRATIPYESLDPLTIGAADDDSKVYREVLELDIPQANLLAAIYPQEPTHLPDATAATARGARAAGHRTEVLRADRGREVRRDRDRQPVPARRRNRGCCPRSSTRSRPPEPPTPR